VDHSDIEPGQHFGSVIAAAVGSCDLLIAVIGGSVVDAEIFKTKGEIFIGKEKVQELTSSSQKVGQRLKTCCVVLRSGQLNPDQFQRCVETAQNYEAVVTNVVAAWKTLKPPRGTTMPISLRLTLSESIASLMPPRTFR
jgi:hypothetical protein